MADGQSTTIPGIELLPNALSASQSTDEKETQAQLFNMDVNYAN